MNESEKTSVNLLFKIRLVRKEM
jgi:hypothetical protein